MRFLLFLGAVLAVAGGTTVVIQLLPLGRQDDAPAPAPVEQYLLKPGEQAQIAPTTSTTLFGIEYGMTVEQIDDLLPPAAEKRILPGSEDEAATQSWEWDGLRIKVEFDRELRTVSEPLVSRDDQDAPQVILPRDLVLGRSTVADFMSALGPPDSAVESYETGRRELDLGWSLDTDVTESFGASVIVPDTVEDVGPDLCSIAPWLYTEGGLGSAEFTEPALVQRLACD